MALLKLFTLVLFLAGCTTSPVVPSTTTTESALAEGEVDYTYHLPSFEGPYPELRKYDFPYNYLSRYENMQIKELYRFSYDERDSSRKEIGIIVNPGTDQEDFVVTGEYSYRLNNYKGDHAINWKTVTYIADKNGFRVTIIRTSALPTLGVLRNLVG